MCIVCVWVCVYVGMSMFAYMWVCVCVQGCVEGCEMLKSRMHLLICFCTRDLIIPVSENSKPPSDK